ncbi:amidohydrolase family protein [Ruminococcus flavefaciens]|uniref:amidohydrolase family protein n=1 Tax=Ruminococcus flavefaciens TaxID=1265 RepID=UPI0026E94ABC|nr:amidohydrolase family protein [Ruminococcus flavefaciens]
MNPEVYGKYEIIDAHAHIFPHKIAEAATESIGHFYDIPMNSCGLTDKLLEAGSKIGVSKYLVCSTATAPRQTEAINTFIAKKCDQHECFYGFGTTHADSENIEADIEQIKRFGLHGVKLHPDFQKFNADSPEAFKIYEQIEGQLPLLIHCGDARYDYSAPQRIKNIHDNFPKLQLMAAHLGGYQQWESAEELLAGLDNVRFDFSSSLAFLTPERAAHIIRRYGIENCFFGSDFPMWSHEDELTRFLALGFTEEENQKMLATNFKEFLGL